MNEFAAVGEDMEKQEKQNYKHEVHLLVLNNHFVVPVIDIPHLGTEAVLDKVEAKMHWVFRKAVEGMVVVAVGRTVADRAVEIGCKALLEEDFEDILQARCHMVRAGSRVPMADYKSEAKQKLSTGEERMVVDIPDTPETRTVQEVETVWFEHSPTQEYFRRCQCYRRSVPQPTWLLCARPVSFSGPQVIRTWAFWQHCYQLCPEPGFL